MLLACYCRAASKALAFPASSQPCAELHYLVSKAEGFFQLVLPICSRRRSVCAVCTEFAGLPENVDTSNERHSSMDKSQFTVIKVNVETHRHTLA